MDASVVYIGHYQLMTEFLKMRHEHALEIAALTDNGYDVLIIFDDDSDMFLNYEIEGRAYDNVEGHLTAMTKSEYLKDYKDNKAK